MITIAIIGVLASTAASGFGAYKKKVQESEATMILGELYRGAAAYWHRPVTAQGLGASGSGRCIVPEPGGEWEAFPPFPLVPEKRTFDFTTVPSFAALGYSKADPSYFSLGWDAFNYEVTPCGDHGDGNPVYIFHVVSDIDGDGNMGGMTLGAFQRNGEIARHIGYLDVKSFLEMMGIPCESCAYGVD
ncbi:MAG: type II secretion system protein [Myxococcales bacterium]|nr:type II secretion system protein [Myxococcales bacterium]